MILLIFPLKITRMANLKINYNLPLLKTPLSRLLSSKRKNWQDRHKMGL